MKYEIVALEDFTIGAVKIQAGVVLESYAECLLALALNSIKNYEYFKCPVVLEKNNEEER